MPYTTRTSFTEIEASGQHTVAVAVLRANGDWEDLDPSQPIGLIEGELVRVRLINTDLKGP